MEDYYRTPELETKEAGGEREPWALSHALPGSRDHLPPATASASSRLVTFSAMWSTSEGTMRCVRW